MADEPTRAVLNATSRLVQSTDAPLLLAVSGGVDSMVLLHAMHDIARERIAGVATFDHATGATATRAVRHVARTARRYGLRLVRGRFDVATVVGDGREAAWRSARYAFLRAAAVRFGAQVVTAHTRDDQVETVLMRIMRGSGTRGLAALNASSDIRRPLVSVSRDEILAYAGSRGVQWVDDPSNASPAFTRNRLRNDILPALRGVDPSFDDAMLALSERAAACRTDVDAFARTHLSVEVGAGNALRVASLELADYDRDSTGMLWSSLANRVGLALDHRGTRRIIAFTMTRPRRGSIPLAGGWLLEATSDSYVLRRAVGRPVSETLLPLEPGDSVEWGTLRFRLASPTEREAEAASPWNAAIAADRSAVVRVWSAGDRLEPAAGQPRRRVTRYLSDVRISGSERAGWPVVMAGEDVVWIPGVRRSDAATDRSGRPVRHYVCERIDR